MAVVEWGDLRGRTSGMAAPWSALEGLRTMLGETLVHTGAQPPTSDSHKSPLTGVHGKEPSQRASWAEPRIFIGGPCEGTTWMARLARTLLALHGFPVHNHSGANGSKILQNELRSLHDLQSSVEGAQKMGHTLVSKWAAAAPWEAVGSARTAGSGSPVGKYLLNSRAHLVYYHRSDLLARTVCMVRDFAWRRQTLATIGHMVEPGHGARLERMTGNERRALPAGEVPSLWVNTSAFVAYLLEVARLHEDRYRHLSVAYQAARQRVNVKYATPLDRQDSPASTNSVLRMPLFLYEDLAAFEFGSSADGNRSSGHGSGHGSSAVSGGGDGGGGSSAVSGGGDEGGARSAALAANLARSSQAWWRLLRAWGVPADAEVISPSLGACLTPTLTSHLPPLTSHLSPSHPLPPTSHLSPLTPHL